MSTTDLEAGPTGSEKASAAASLAVPPTAHRGMAAFLELFLYSLITMLVAIAEYYLERLIPDDADSTAGAIFGPVDAVLSNITQTIYRVERTYHDLLGNDQAYADTVDNAARALIGVREGAPVGDFAPSNWVIAFVIYAVWSLFTARRSTTPAAGVMQMTLIADNGEPAGFVRTVVRSLIRGAVLFALPLLAFDRNQLMWIGLFIAAGMVIRSMPLRRAPWDLIAGTTIVESYGVEEPASAGALTIGDLKVDGVRQAQNRRARRLLQGTGWGAIVVSLLIVWVVFSEAWEFVSAEDFNWGLLNIEGKSKGWFPRRDLYDLSTLLVGTLWVTGIAMLVAGPVGLGVAIYLSEYAKPKIQRIVKPIIEMLASVPSVVIGMFAIFFVSPTLLRAFFDDIGIFSILAAGLGVGILTVPLVASISEDALRAVPRELREAAYGLGSRKITVALRVVFPAALSGISAAFIVGISRAIGETMVVAIAAGGSGGTLFQLNPTEPGQTITAAMASLGAGTDQVAGSGIAFQSLYFLGALLFILTLLLNVFSDAIVRRFREVY